MSKVSLANSVADVLNISHDKANDYVSVVIDSIKQGVKKNGRMVVRGFGVFTTKGKTKRMGRNPKTGKPAVIKARTVIRFKASKLFKDKVNRGK
jgi:nucleoid DNA-binding protein